MKKLTKAIATTLFAGCMAFAVAGCAVSGDSSSDSTIVQTHDERIVAVYTSYCQYMAANGETPLTYEQWLEDIKGANGRDGLDGLTPYIGTNGNWWIGSQDTEVPAQGATGATGATGNGVSSIEKTATNGLVDTYTITYTDGSTTTFTVTNGANGQDGAQGIQGIQGIQGVPGKDGHTPVITIAGGYWCIDGVSTGILAQGEKGDKGDQGDKGDKGDKGDQGEQGVGIANVEINADGDLMVTLTDGTVKNAGKVTSDSTGVGVTEIDITANKTLLITLSNGIELETMPLDLTFDSYVTGFTITAEGELIVHTALGDQSYGKIARVYATAENELIAVFESGSEMSFGKLSGFGGSVTGTPCVHKFSDWIVGMDATCESMGYNSRVCVYCGVLDYDFKAPTGHIWNSIPYVLDLPQEDKDGAGLVSCSVCEVTKLVTIDWNGDLDQDGLTNGEEISQYHTDILVADTDNDGLTDYEEVVTYNTDPLNADTDSDGAKDGAEVKFGTDPLVAQTAFNVDAVIETSDDTVKPGVQLNGISAEQLNSLKIEQNDYFEEAQTPGYMGQAYDYDMETEGNVNATIVFEFEQPTTFALARATSVADPIIYRYDATRNALFPQPTRIADNKAYTEVTEFGSYILLDRRIYNEEMAWVDVVKKDSNYSAIEIVLVVDDSGSMTSNDSSNQRLTVAKDLIDGLPANSKIGIVEFDDRTTIHTKSLTTDKSVAKSYLSKTYFSSYGTTYMYTAIEDSFSLFGSSDSATMKMMVVLSDGNAHDTKYASSVISTAKTNDVAIYTIGLGSSSSSYFNNYLKPLAEQTGGKFYLSANASGLNEVYKNIGDTIDILTDTDKDGISDYYEEHMPIINGLELTLDKNNPDTDGDRLLDGEEVKVVYVYDGATYETSTKLTFYGKIYSNPTLVDSDGDGVEDRFDRFPMNPNKN